MGRHAYLIIAHNNWYILSKLVSTLDYYNNDIYIHIDRKSNPSDRLKQSIANQVNESKLFFIESKPVYWGGYTLIDVTLRLLTAAAEKQHYLYYHLLSGCDLPIKNQKHIHEFFDANQGAEFVHFGKEEWNKKIQSRLKYYWIFQDFAGNSRRIDKLTLRALDRICVFIQKMIGIDRLKDLQLSAGSEWFSISDDFARFLLSKKDYIKKHFKYGICSDESFVQTIIIDSVFREKIYNLHGHLEQDCILRYLQWENGKPRVLKTDDFNRLISSGCLFARKFNEDDKGFIEKICMTALGKEETLTDNSFANESSMLACASGGKEAHNGRVI